MRCISYHGGVGDLPVGGLTLPPCETGYLYGDRDDRVYMTTDLMQAINCAVIMKGMIYRVQPIGRLSPDDDDIGPNYTAHRALILAREAVPARLARCEYADFGRLVRDYVDLQLALGL
jgi:hypothetical protein